MPNYFPSKFDIQYDKLLKPLGMHFKTQIPESYSGPNDSISRKGTKEYVF